MEKPTLADFEFFRYASQDIEDSLLERKLKENRGDIHIFSDLEHTSENVDRLGYVFGLTPSAVEGCFRAVHLLRDHAPVVFDYLVETGLFSVEKIAAAIRPLLVLPVDEVKKNQRLVLEIFVPNKKGSKVPQASSLLNGAKKVLKKHFPQWVQSAKKEAEKAVDNVPHAEVVENQDGSVSLALRLPASRAQKLMHGLRSIALEHSCNIGQALELLIARDNGLAQLLIWVADSPRMPRKLKKQLKTRH